MKPWLVFLFLWLSLILPGCRSGVRETEVVDALEPVVAISNGATAFWVDQAGLPISGPESVSELAVVNLVRRSPETRLTPVGLPVREPGGSIVFRSRTTSGEECVVRYTVHLATGGISQEVSNPVGMPKLADWMTVPGSLDATPGGKVLRIEIAAPTGQATPGATWEIEGPEEDVRYVRESDFILRASIPLNATTPACPFGKTNAVYHGCHFWDSDLWILPYLIWTDPTRTTKIGAGRLAFVPEAIKLADSWVQANRPTAKAELGPTSYLLGTALKFPWQSNSAGQEASPSETKHQDHVTASILLGLDWASALDRLPGAEIARVGRLAARFAELRSKRRSDGLMGVPSTVSPSEWHVADNDLYTNAAFAWLRRRFAPEHAAEYYYPRDSTSYLTFDGDEVRQYQQAAALLAIFPLQDEKIEAEARAMLDRFSDRTSRQGPAMSYSINAIIAARLGETELAYAHWQRSWKTYVDEYGVFHEKSTKAGGDFMTGRAASLNVLLYGFLGLRLDRTEPQVAVWKQRLKNGYWASAKPNLPKAWRRLALKGVQFDGQVWDFELTQTGLQVKTVASPR